MLTPALRVASAAADEAESDLTDEDAAVVDATEDVAATCAAEAETREDPADDFAATLSSLGFTEFSQTQDAPRVLQPSEMAEPEPDFGTDMMPDAASTPENRSRLEATIAELEAAITHKREEWEPDGSEEAPVMDWAAARADDTPFLSRRSASRLRDLPEASFTPEQEAAEAPLDHASRSVEPRNEAQPDMSEYRVADLYEDATGFSELGDLDEKQQDQDTRALRPDRSEDLPRQDHAGDSTELDEAVLRAIIAEVVREELQGPLGERLTRNVRKLVRREIHRALSNGSFD